MIIRLASVPFSFNIMRLFWLMLPLIFIFAVPIASSLAVGITVGNLYVRDELLLLHYFPDIRKKLELAVWIFSLVLLVFYIPIVFQIAPSSYWKGKRFLVRAAHIQIENLPPQKFHTVASRCTIFFRDKNKTGQTQFKDILLMVKQKNKKQYLVTARFGVLQDGKLYLTDGTIYNHDAKNQCVATFKTLEIAFEKMFFDSEKNISKPTKFMAWDELIESDRDRAKQEFHKRVGQILWQFLIPFFMLWMIMILGRKKNNFLTNIIVGGGFFLFSYVSLNMAYFFLNNRWGNLVIFYSIPLVIAGTLFVWYHRSSS